MLKKFLATINFFGKLKKMLHNSNNAQTAREYINFYIISTKAQNIMVGCYQIISATVYVCVINGS